MRRFSILFVVFLSIVVAGRASAADGISIYFEPIVGFYRVTLKALEIETVFLNVGTDEEVEWVPLEDTVLEPSVGRQVFYKGNGVAVGGSAGINLFSISFGIAYLWHSVTFDGYSKRYRLSLDTQGAGGRLFWDSGVVNLHRIMAQIWHRLPIVKIHFDFMTRLGGIIVDQGPLIVGRAIKVVNGFTGDVGVGLSVVPKPFLNVGIMGVVGFYSFSGKYEGAYGMIMGMEAKIVFNI